MTGLRGDLAHAGDFADQQFVVGPDLAVGGEQFAVAGHQGAFFGQPQGRQQLAGGLGAGDGEPVVLGLEAYGDARAGVFGFDAVDVAGSLAHG
ncbi:hypothetical protein DESPIG_01971 [Desulfovibrio piger ATCC 29098]|uniref:Uncharacterized protein n=1 Tax=Desulfovibrio piger ATCC 29098 TaxID=411464 RepID=B6WV56_9BACT|nr:hypothetical protein DESPIG_01971 [Desulfovibrio piger ATCC 29098]